MRTVKLTLPLPDGVNARPSHPMAAHRAKNKYRKRAWAEAIQQARPHRDPPERVVVMARFYMVQRMDGDNMVGRLKWVLDALKQRQTGAVRWRQGVADECGYFVDDDPDHMRLGSVTQHRVETMPERRLEVEIVDVSGGRAA